MAGILAGGASRRMGQDKAALDWHGLPLLEHMLALARVAGAGEIAVAGPHAPAGIERLNDAVAGRGPIGGLIALLRWRPRVLVVACDLPRLSPALLRFLWERGAGFAGWTLPEGQPLCAVYTRELLPWLEAAVAGAATPGLDVALEGAPRQQIRADELAAHGFDPGLFANLNTPFDYAAAGDTHLRDSFGRVITDLRISVTERCNYRCLYCRYGAGDGQAAESALGWPDLRQLARTFVDLGIRKVRLTGGEPLLRAGLADFVRYVADLGVPDIALTTNGHLFAAAAGELRRAGLSRVTISLDSLVPEKFARITRVDGLGRVLAAITAAQEQGLNPVKVNVVLLRGHNDDEVEALGAFARERGVVLRFIEFMPLEAGELWQPGLVVSMQEILERLQRAFPLEALPPRQSETARRFRFADGALGEIGIVAPVTSPFCNQCSRIRLTADGKLRTCLFSLREWDLRPALAEGEAALARLIRHAVDLKEERHHIGEASFHKPQRSMVQIGG